MTSLSHNDCQEVWSITPALSNKQALFVRYSNILNSQHLDVEKEKKNASKAKAFWCPLVKYNYDFPPPPTLSR